MELENAERVDRFVVEGVLGRGGMAIVYRVRHVTLGTPFALKVLRLQGGGISRRLEQEAKVQATLFHPNLVRVTDVVNVRGTPGLIMEYVSGPPLSALIAGQPMELSLADSLAAGILAGMAEAHRFGFVHRDLKPANILLQPDGRGMVPKISDFGLVKALLDEQDGGNTVTAGTMGTPPYMSPEQFRSAKNVDQRADVWSLGILLYEMLSGCRPYAGEDLLSVHEALCAGPPVPIGDRVPNLPPRMIATIDAALRKDLSTRPANAAALLELWTGVPAGPGPTLLPGSGTPVPRPKTVPSPGVTFQPSVAPPPPRRLWVPLLGIVAALVVIGGLSRLGAPVSAPLPTPPPLPGAADRADARRPDFERDLAGCWEATGRPDWTGSLSFTLSPGGEAVVTGLSGEPATPELEGCLRVALQRADFGAGASDPTRITWDWVLRSTRSLIESMHEGVDASVRTCAAPRTRTVATADLTLSADGTPAMTKLATHPPDATVEGCIASAINGSTFPSGGDGTTVVTWTWSFGGRAPQPPPVAATGVLRISAIPWGYVAVDGVEVGRTFWSKALPMGNHAVRIRSSETRAEKLLEVEVRKDVPTILCWNFRTGDAC